VLTLTFATQSELLRPLLARTLFFCAVSESLRLLAWQSLHHCAEPDYRPRMDYRLRPGGIITTRVGAQNLRASAQ